MRNTIFFNSEKWWRGDIFLMLLNFCWWYSWTWERWLLVQCYLVLTSWLRCIVFQLLFNAILSMTSWPCVNHVFLFESCSRVKLKRNQKNNLQWKKFVSSSWVSMYKPVVNKKGKFCNALKNCITLLNCI